MALVPIETLNKVEVLELLLYPQRNYSCGKLLQPSLLLLLSQSALACLLMVPPPICHTNVLVCEHVQHLAKYVIRWLSIL